MGRGRGGQSPEAGVEPRSSAWAYDLVDVERELLAKLVAERPDLSAAAQEITGLIDGCDNGSPQAHLLALGDHGASLIEVCEGLDYLVDHGLMQKSDEVRHDSDEGFGGPCPMFPKSEYEQAIADGEDLDCPGCGELLVDGGEPADSDEIALQQMPGQYEYYSPESPQRPADWPEASLERL